MVSERSQEEKDYLSVIPYLYEVKGKKHAKLIWSRIEVRIVVILRVY